MSNEGRGAASFVVERVGVILDCFQRCTLYHLLRQRIPEPAQGENRGRIDQFVDIFVCAMLAMATLAYILSFWVPGNIFGFVCGVIVILFSVHRIIDIATFHLNLLLGRPGYPGGVSTVASYSRSLLLALANYIEITFWFAVCYSILKRNGQILVEGVPALSILRESLVMMVLNSTGKVDPGVDVCGWIAILLHTMVGILMTLVVLARAVALVQRPGVDNGE